MSKSWDERFKETDDLSLDKCYELEKKRAAEGKEGGVVRSVIEKKLKEIRSGYSDYDSDSDSCGSDECGGCDPED